MRFEAINAAFTEHVRNALNLGFVINCGTMGGSGGEIAKVDITDGMQIFRVVLKDFHVSLYQEGVEIVFGKPENPVLPNLSDRQSKTFFTDHLVPISTERFYLIDRYKGWYGTAKESFAAELCRKRRLVNRTSSGPIDKMEIKNPRAKEIAKRRVQSVCGVRIAMKRIQHVWAVHYKGDPKLHFIVETDSNTFRI